MKLHWLPDAIRELNKIYNYYVARSPKAAATLYNTILDEAELLVNQPYIAAVEPIFEDFTETIRALVVAMLRYC